MNNIEPYTNEAGQTGERRTSVDSQGNRVVEIWLPAAPALELKTRVVVDKEFDHIESALDLVSKKLSNENHIKTIKAAEVPLVIQNHINENHIKTINRRFWLLVVAGAVAEVWFLIYALSI